MLQVAVDATNGPVVMKDVGTQILPLIVGRVGYCLWEGGIPHTRRVHCRFRHPKLPVYWANCSATTYVSRKSPRTSLYATT